MASNNKSKLAEVRAALSACGYEVVSPFELGLHIDPGETGATYRENSYIKALAFSQTSALPVISDDSGFEVEALGGKPGLFSSRFAAEQGGDYEKAGRALNEMLGDSKNRKAKFHCCICFLKSPDEEPLYFEGDFPGTLLSKSSGHGGFGYDPYFHSEELDLDMGLASPEIKSQYSHRAKALKKLVEYLNRAAEQ